MNLARNFPYRQPKSDLPQPTLDFYTQIRILTPALKTYVHELSLVDQWAQIAPFLGELVLARKRRDLLYGSADNFWLKQIY